MVFTTQQITDAHRRDMEIEAKMDLDEAKANANASKQDRLPRRLVKVPINTNNLTDKIARMNIGDYEIEAELAQIAKNARLTEEEKQIKSILTPMDKEMLDFYKQKALLEAGSGVIGLPELEPTRYTEQEWAEIDDRFSALNIIPEINRIQRVIDSLIRLAGELRNDPKKQAEFNNTESALRRYTEDMKAYKRRMSGVEDARREYIAGIILGNREKVNEFEDRISKMANAGLVLERLPNERDEDYLKRSEANLDIMSTADQLEKAKLYISREFLMLLKSLGIDQSVAESVNSTLDPVIKERIIVTKQNFKSKLERIAGKQIYRWSPEVLNEFIDNYEGIAESTRRVIPKEAIKEPIEVAGEEVFEEEKPKRGRTPLKSYQSIVPVGVSNEEWATYNKSFKFQFLKQKYKEHPERFINKPKQQDRVTDLDAMFFRYVKGLTEGEESSSGESSRRSSFSGESSEGGGFKHYKHQKHLHTHSHEYKPLGDKFINMKKLREQNEIILRNRSGIGFLGFPNTIVSDLFARFLTKIIDGKKIDEYEIHRLPALEQTMFKRLFQIIRKSPTKQGHNLGELKARLKLVEDEILAGNDSKHLLTEAKELLMLLQKLGAITASSRQAYIKGLM